PTWGQIFANPHKLPMELQGGYLTVNLTASGDYVPPRETQDVPRAIYIEAGDGEEEKWIVTDEYKEDYLDRVADLNNHVCSYQPMSEGDGPHR
ncbi:MAG: hypothetical protein SVU32_06775, partial [Candidatus Nanohaloarchaea archaeon]|nr:hypothetical protein [Candidatus Nanohaloarchaea archaeon]